MIGDRLAKGAKSASFGSLAHIPQAKWDAIWADYEPKETFIQTKVDKASPFYLSLKVKA